MLSILNISIRDGSVPEISFVCLFYSLSNRKYIVAWGHAMKQIKSVVMRLYHVCLLALLPYDEMIDVLLQLLPFPYMIHVVYIRFGLIRHMVSLVISQCVVTVPRY